MPRCCGGQDRAAVLQKGVLRSNQGTVPGIAGVWRRVWYERGRLSPSFVRGERNALLPFFRMAAAKLVVWDLPGTSKEISWDLVRVFLGVLNTRYSGRMLICIIVQRYIENGFSVSMNIRGETFVIIQSVLRIPFSHSEFILTQCGVTQKGCSPGLPLLWCISSFIYF